MGASSSTVGTEPKALKDGIRIIDDALDRQYQMLEKLADECNNLRAEREKKKADVERLENQYVQCRSALDVLTQRDEKLRESVAKVNKRYGGQYTDLGGKDPYKGTNKGLNGRNRGSDEY